MNPHCRACHYRRPLGSKGTIKICYYCFDTGKPRGCPVDQCDKRITNKDFARKEKEQKK